MNTEVMFSSKTDDWATPQAFFDELDQEFHFTLDAAADECNHKCKRYYDENKDGLKMSWEGITFCNPPYGREIGKWVEKAYEEYIKGATVVMLLPARTDTKWFHDFVLNKAEVRFIRGRLKFGNEKNNTPFPSMEDCVECLERWLLSRARWELKKEKQE